MAWLLLPLALFAVGCLADPVTVFNLPPVRSLREAGFLHGQHAAGNIRAFLATDEIAEVLRFANAEGSDALSSLRGASLEVAPQLAEELEGIAEGSGVAELDLWAVTLISELEALMQSSGDHCSDIVGRSENGEVWHGHTEDWSMAFKPLVYFVIYNTAPQASFRSIGGMVYPGQPPGFAVAFTANTWTTSNSLFPSGINTSGVAVVATARAALSLPDARQVAQGYMQNGQAYGMNTQVVGYQPGRAFAGSIESAGAADQVALSIVGENASHFNNYKHLSVASRVDESSLHRQATTDLHDAPSSRQGVLSILGNTNDAAFPVYRANHTMFATVFHSSTGRFWVWHGTNPRTSDPSWSSSLAEIFATSDSATMV